MNQFITLSNGSTLPQIGLGTYQLSNDEAETAVGVALQAGYRLIDTAKLYNNEEGVGRAIAASSIPRDELFITTKLWNTDQGYDSALAAFEASRKRLGLDYVDLYLIHWPAPARDAYIDTWRALETLYADGKVRAIGVSNFMPEHLERLLKNATTPPMVNQIEIHPGFLQQETRDFCAAHAIAVESWSPLGGGRKLMIHEPAIETIASRLNKTPAQVVIRWHLQQGLVVIPRSSNPDRIRENINVFDFILSDEDMEAINAIGSSDRHGPDPRELN